jgi:ribosomal protein S1
LAYKSIPHFISLPKRLNLLLRSAKHQNTENNDLGILRHRQNLYDYAEKEKGLDETSKEELMKPLSVPKIGDYVTGVVRNIDEDGVKVVIDDLYDAYIPKIEGSLFPFNDLSQIYTINQNISAHVIATLKGTPVLSPRHDETVKSYNLLMDAYNNNHSVNALICDVNSGGVILYSYGLFGFLPGSFCINRIPSKDRIGTYMKASHIISYAYVAD